MMSQQTAGPDVQRPAAPVLWQEQLREPGLFWQQEVMHFPDAMTPMEAAMIERCLGPAFAYGVRSYEAPIARVEAQIINGYMYQAVVPMEGSPEELMAAGERAQQAMIGAIGRLDALWGEDILPAVRRQLAFFEEFDPAGASRAALVEHLDEAWKRVARIWELHFRTVFPVYLAISEFDELYRGLFPGSGPLDSYKLLEGLPNMTVQVGQELWRLSRRAAGSPEVARVLRDTPAREVPGALRATAEGRAFLAELDEYLAFHGRRADKWTMAAPSWTEDPTPVIESLREFAGRSAAEAPEVMSQMAAAGREKATAEARERLAGYPAPVVGQFEAMLAAARTATVLSEDHNFWIDNMVVHYLRCVLLACGARLVDDGALDRPGDVLMLAPEELREALQAPGADLRPTVAARTAELERQRELDPPPVLGAIPDAPPPDDPFGRFAAKFFGAPPAEPEAPGELRGAPGSAGRVRGTARIIHSIAEAGRLREGDILVAETTAPPWTPLFATVAAVVTDTGGVLSHCAVVAREYGIPAVVGTAVGSRVIADGDRIEVDGDAGIVRII